MTGVQIFGVILFYTLFTCVATNIQMFNYGMRVMLGWVIGAIMGDASVGMYIGATMSLMGLGIDIGFGGSSVPDYTLGTIPSLNKKAVKIDIVVTNKNDFKGLQDNDKFVISYMMLADYIGEMCVDAYIGGISFGKPSLFKNTSAQKEVALADLLEYITGAVKEQGWIQPENIKLIASSFKSEKPKTVVERKDFLEGFSYCVDILNEEGTPSTNLTDYIKSLGIGIYSICTDKDLSNDKKSKERKDNVEKKLSAILVRNKSGYMTNSISGKAHDYVDFFLYDNKMLDVIRREIIVPGSGSRLIEL